MKVLLLNMILLASAALVAYGLWLYSHSLAYIVVGFAMMVVTFVIGVAHGAKHSKTTV